MVNGGNVEIVEPSFGLCVIEGKNTSADDGKFEFNDVENDSSVSGGNDVDRRC